MSHLVSIKTKIQDVSAVAAACRRLGLAEPTHGTAKLYSGEVTGLLVQLPQWEFPIAINTSTGAIEFDNFNGAWGEQRELDKFLQMYAVEKTRIEARKKGYAISETQQQDGSVRLQIREGFA